MLEDSRNEGRAQYTLVAPRRLIVKFAADVAIPADPWTLTGDRSAFLAARTLVAETFGGRMLLPRLAGVSFDSLEALEHRARRMDPDLPPIGLGRYAYIELDEHEDPSAGIDTLRESSYFETVYVEGRPSEPPTLAPDDTTLQKEQTYQDPAPIGVDSEFAWTIAGGDGAGASVLDLEQGWGFGHVDLPAGMTASLRHGVSAANFGHGTAVLGILCAANNGVGIVGSVPGATVLTASEWSPDPAAPVTTPPTLKWDLVAAMNAVVNTVPPLLGEGDILLIESQLTGAALPPNDARNLPVETDTEIWGWLRTLAALNITVVEAAGNGSTNLDTVMTSDRGQVFRLGDALVDSKAILVSGAATNSFNERRGAENWGPRVDCFAAAEGVETLGADDYAADTAHYRSDFNGTSSATAIVATAAAATQGMRRAGYGDFLKPGDMRAMLTDTTFNTPSQNPTVDLIGVMPDLRGIATDGLKVAPDLRFEKAWHPAWHPDPMWDPDYGDTLIAHDVPGPLPDTVVWLVRNGGRTPVPGVFLRAYVSPPTTLPCPDLLRPIGRLDLGTLPPSDRATRTDGLGLPRDGERCLLATLGAEGLAPIRLKNLEDLQALRHLAIRGRTLSTHFVVEQAAPHAGSVARLEFLLCGAREKADMELRFTVRASAGLQFGLRGGSMLDSLLSSAAAVVGADRTSTPGSRPIPDGRGRVLGHFPAMLREQCEVSVHTTGPAIAGCEFTVLQVYRGVPIGGFTWKVGAI